MCGPTQQLDSSSHSLLPFQKNNKNESSRGMRQALKALLESREVVLRQRLQGSLEESHAQPAPVGSAVPEPSSPFNHLTSQFTI